MWVDTYPYALFTYACVKRGAILIIVSSNGIRFEKIAGNCSRSRLRAKASVLHSQRILGALDGYHVGGRHDNAFVDAFREAVRKSERVSVGRIVDGTKTCKVEGREGETSVGNYAAKDRRQTNANGPVWLTVRGLNE